MPRWLTASFVAFNLVAASLADAQSPELWRDLPAGQHAVGFAARVLADSTRSLGGGSPRPVQISLWYPSMAGPRMPFARYVAWYERGIVPVDSRDSLPGDVARDYAKAWFPGQTLGAVQRLLELPTGAALNGQAAPGRFPVIVYVPGLGGTPLTHTVTCELLASRGFVVASIPSRGATVLGQTFDRQGQEAEVRDAELALSVAKSWPNADGSRAASIGFSMGGGIAVLLAMTHPEIRAVASLDGTIGWSPFTLVTASDRFDAGAFHVPLLHLNSARDPTNSDSLIQRFALSERRIVTLKGMDHHDFIARNVIARIVTGAITDTAWVGYRTATRYLLAFMEAFVGGDERARAALSDTRQFAAPPGFATVRQLDDQSHGFFEDTLAAMLTDRATIPQALVEIRRLHDAMGGDGPVRPPLIEVAAAKLRDANHDPEAAVVLRAETALFPANYSAFVMLGDVERALGRREASLRAYRRALALDPTNLDAKAALAAAGLP